MNGHPQLPLAGTSELVIQQSSRFVLQPLSPLGPRPQLRLSCAPAGGLGRGECPCHRSGGLSLKKQWAGPGPVTPPALWDLSI